MLRSIEMIRNYQNPKADKFFTELISNYTAFPLAFCYDKKEYSGFSDCEFELVTKESRKEADKETAILVITLKREIRITIKSEYYSSHGVTEWIAEFENITGANSRILENIRTSMRFDGENPTLKGILGDHVNYYRPYSTDLTKEKANFVGNTGRATHEVFPYFNLERGNGGTILAIGWSGTWEADFEYKSGEVVYMGKSVPKLRAYLKPQEKIRTARFLVAEYTVRDEDYATNYWRDYYVKHIMPKADAAGNPLEPFSTCCLASDTGLPNSDGSISERYSTWRPTLEKMLAENIKVDFRWVDAGWYVAPDKTSPQPYVEGHDWRDTLGTWELDPEKWSGETFLESTDFARANGMKTLLWFASEKVTMPEELEKNYGYKKEWALAPTGMEDNTFTSNLGYEECLKWTIDRICKVLRDNKVDMFREDNGSRCEYWTTGDILEGEDRSGITEIKCLDGHYKIWEAAIEATKSTGGCAFVDSCCGGGGRNDLESMRLSVPLLRSDHDRMTTGIRLSQTSSINKWIPFCGANTKEKKWELDATGNSDVYIWRASYLPALNVDSQFVQDPNQDFSILRNGINEWKEVKDYLLGEFYTLTPWHHENDLSGFTAYTYFNPETEMGVLFVFRQEECENSEITLKFSFAQNKELFLTDKDTKETFTTKNRELTLCIPEKRTAKLYFYTLK